MRSAAQERRDVFLIELLKNHLDKNTLKYFFGQTIIFYDLLLSLVQNHFFAFGLNILIWL